MAKVIVNMGRLNARKPRMAPTPQEVLATWDSGNTEPFCRALWFAGPAFLSQQESLIRKLYECWSDAILGDPESRERWRQIIKALHDVGPRGKLPDLERTPKDIREKQNRASQEFKDFDRLVKKYEKWKQKRLSQEDARKQTIQDFCENTRIKDPQRRRKAIERFRRHVKEETGT